METANGKKKHPNDTTREVVEAAKSGDAVLLNEILREMNSSERTFALETNMDALLCFSATEYDTFQVTPLILAVKSGNVDCVEVLLNYKADMEGRGDYDIYDECDLPRRYSYGGCTPLFVAAAYGHLDVLRCLIENGADVNAATYDKSTPLMIASGYGHVNVVTCLIEHGANMDLKHKTGQTVLHYAVDRNNDCCDVLSRLIKNGGDVNARDYGDKTPLITASKNHNINLVTFLIENGANMDLQDIDGKTALHYAVDSCGVLDCLIRNGADVNTRTKYDNCTPLMIASKKGLLNVVTFLIVHGAKVDQQDKNGKTALHHAVHSCDVLSCLIKNGADVNACTNDNCTPLMRASKKGLVNVVTLLIEHGANVELQDENGKTALHHAVHSCDVLSCLIRNGADVNVCKNMNCTPLMIASSKGYMNAVTLLLECGANINQQDKNGETALHYAVKGNSSEVAHKLLSLGASQLCNNQGLTPLLLASNKCAISVVEYLTTRGECTKKQNIDALELLGASLAICTGRTCSYLYTLEGFRYMKRGMEERFADPSHPLLKQPMEPVGAYQNRRESQTLDELVQIEGDEDAIIMEGLIIRERILGTNNVELLGPIRMFASYVYGELHYPTRYRDLSFKKRGHSICIELYKHAMNIAKSCNQPNICDLFKLTQFLYDNVWTSDPPKENDILELLEQTVLEYEKRQKFRRRFEHGSILQQLDQCRQLFDSAMKLVQTIVHFKLYEEGKSLCFSVLLKRLCCLNPQDEFGDSLLHSAVEEFTSDVFLCLDTVKLLLKAGSNVNAINDNGDTPLHRAVTFKPSEYDEIHLLTCMLEVLLDGGAHHDFVNNDGKTAMDIAQSNEACWILSEKRKLELKCISARAVKMFGIPYLSIVPKMLEKYISMH